MWIHIVSRECGRKSALSFLSSASGQVFLSSKSKVLYFSLKYTVYQFTWRLLACWHLERYTWDKRKTIKLSFIIPTKFLLYSKIIKAQIDNYFSLSKNNSWHSVQPCTFLLCSSDIWNQLVQKFSLISDKINLYILKNHTNLDTCHAVMTVF